MGDEELEIYDVLKDFFKYFLEIIEGLQMTMYVAVCYVLLFINHCYRKLQQSRNENSLRLKQCTIHWFIVACGM